MLFPSDRVLPYVYARSTPIAANMRREAHRYPGRKPSDHQDVEKCILLLKSGRVSISLTSRRASISHHELRIMKRTASQVPRLDEPVAELYNPPNFIRLSELRKFSLVDRLPAQMGTQNYVRTDFAQVCGLHFTTYICMLLLSR